MSVRFKRGECTIKQSSLIRNMDANDVHKTFCLEEMHFNYQYKFVFINHQV